MKFKENTIEEENIDRLSKAFDLIEKVNFETNHSNRDTIILNGVAETIKTVIQNNFIEKD
jgi:hypothetical protein